jgi:LysR family cys regulon transcriptional activator
MTLQQLRFFREVARHGLNITAAAKALCTSQPGISKQLRMLEEELGVELFERDQGRIVELSKPGVTILTIAQRMLKDANSLKEAARDFSTVMSGNLVVATTHTQARYVLPEVLKRFAVHYPKVSVELRQGNTRQVSQLVTSGDADIAIATDASAYFDDLVMIPCYCSDRVVITVPRHPLLKTKRLTLEQLAVYPIIAYDHGFAARQMLVDAFAERRLTPNIVVSALDADVIKACVAMDLGVSVLTRLAFDPRRDRNLRAIDASKLFAKSVTFIGVRRNSFLRRYMFDFIATFAPRLNRRAIEEAMAR